MTTPEQLSKKLKVDFQTFRDRINEDFNRLESECDRTKPDPNNYDLQTLQGRKKLVEDEAAWVEAAAAAMTATTTWTDFFKDLVDQALPMLSDIGTAIVKGITFAYKKLEKFMVWLADRFV